MEESKMNHIVKDKIKKIEDKIVPGVNWNRDKSWNKIKELLNTKNKQLIMWYFATAASLSILVAATSNHAFTYIPFLKDENKVEIVSKKITPAAITQNAKQSNTTQFEITELKKKSLDMVRKAKCNNTSIQPIKSKVNNDVSSKEISRTKHNSFDFKTQGLLNVNNLNGFSPAISADIRYTLVKKGKVNKYIAVGLSSHVIFQNPSETSNNRIYPATFINAKYGQSKLDEDSFKEWEMSAGYLLNPNQVIYKDTTIRLQYTRSISKKIKIGPELIFTNNMKKLYPGITLAFG